MSEHTLLPCPLCGLEELTFINFKGVLIHVECLSCGSGGPKRETKREAIQGWNLIPRHLTWTTEPPTLRGLYWAEDASGCFAKGLPYQSVVEVFLKGNKLVPFYPDSEVDLELANFTRWAGPIPMPKEAKP